MTRSIDGVEVNGKDCIFAWFKQQVQVLNPKREKPVVCVMDGERALWKMLATWLTGIICILDIFHVLERIWEAAHCFHPEGSDEAREFVNQRLKRILEGDVGRVIGGLKQMATKQNLRGAKLKRLQAAIKYLHNNRRLHALRPAPGRRLSHRQRRGRRSVSTSGQGPNGANRHALAGGQAQAMLDLRAVHASDKWEEFQSYRNVAESRRLYPFKELVDSAQRKAA